MGGWEVRRIGEERERERERKGEVGGRRERGGREGEWEGGR